MTDYLWGQLGKALRAGSGVRAGKVLQALAAIRDGTVRVGRSTPVKGMPAWVTPEVIRGGFATGGAAAAGPLAADEADLAASHGVLADRASLFAWGLSDRGLAYLTDLLESQAYRLELPEHGVLLTLAYLLRVNRFEDGAMLLRAVQPWADRLRFLPVAAAGRDKDGVHVATLTEVADRLELKRPSVQVEAQRESNSVWSPYTDRLVALWWDTQNDDGVIGRVFPDEWKGRAVALVEEYAVLARKHTLTRKHARDGSTVQILLSATRGAIVGNREQVGRVRDVIRDVVAKRGTPGSGTLRTVRTVQAAESRRPSHAVVAAEAADTIRAIPSDTSLDDPVSLVGGTAAADLPAVRKLLRQATHAPLETLLQRGIVTSAEVLAALAPQIAAHSVEHRYDDESAGVLAGRLYRAFTNRRSLLLLDYRRQVEVTALPWFTALERDVRPGAEDTGTEQALSLARLAVRHFPGTVLPNPLLRVLDRLFTQSGTPVPLTSELAADIFMGGFSRPFVDAANLAAGLLRGSLYADYYQLPGLIEDQDTFTELAHERANVKHRPRMRWYPTSQSGAVIEQAQILTTHNLAQLVHAGLTDIEWGRAAHDAWAVVLQELERATGKQGLRHRKNAAHAWRQLIFFLTMAGPDAAHRFAATAPRARREPTRGHSDAILTSLTDTLEGRPTRPFTGWVA